MKSHQSKGRMERDELLVALLALREDLRSAGFDPGIQRVQTAIELLLRLAAEGHIGDCRPDWQKWLAPIFCSNGTQQREFESIFAKWARDWQGGSVVRPTVDPDSVEDVEPEEEKRKILPSLLATLRRVFRRLVSIVSIVWWVIELLISVLLIIGYLFGKPGIKISGNVTSDVDYTPIEKAVVSSDHWPDVLTDKDGNFEVEYQDRRFNLILHGLFERPRSIRTTRDGYETLTSEYHISLQQRISNKINVKIPIELRSKQPPPPPKPSPTREKPLDSIKVNGEAYYPLSRSSTSSPVNIVITMLPLMAWVVWMLIITFLRRAFLEKLPSRRLPHLEELRVAGLKDLVFATPRDRRMMVELRRPRQTTFDNLNIDKTLRETIRNGSFSPVYDWRRKTPEYLILIDREGQQDGQARLVEELVRRLRESDVHLHAYYFHRDPRMCKNLIDHTERAVSLTALGGRFRDHRLLIFTDARGFFDQYRGIPNRWLNQFAPWEDRAILTPEPIDRWSRREEILRDQDFILLPISVDGFAGLGQWLNNEYQPAHRGNSSRRFPPLIELRPNRWIERIEPGKEEVDRLLNEIKDYLDQREWRWFCACAVYPEVTWDLTLFLGHALFGGEEDWRNHWMDSMLRLMRLPWFRHGSMPEWLRLKLDESLNVSDARQVRMEINRLLSTANGDAQNQVALSYAVPQGNRFVNRLKDWWRALCLFLGIDKDKEDEPLCDYVFLRFMTGRSLNRLAVMLPDALQRLFFQKGKPWLGVRPGVSFLLVTMVVLGLSRPLPWVEATVKPVGGVFRVERNREGFIVNQNGKEVLKMAIIPAGNFMMGSQSGSSDEKPVHKVAIGPFYIGRTEVTQAQWRTVMGSLPNVRFKGKERPVENVSWEEVQQFCRRLSEETGLEFRLPTEAEWEYAARAGTTTEYSFGDDVKKLGDYAWFDKNSGSSTHAVGQKLPNQFGLYDMHGNVREWCEDQWHENYEGEPGDGSAWLSGGDSTYRVVRGGSWNDNSDYCRSVVRYSIHPDEHYVIIGLRVVVGALTQYSQNRGQG
jgi:formylglycine-generating enzyme required for sulfatase activity